MSNIFYFLQKKFRQNISTKKIKNGQKNIFCFEISNIFDLFSRNFLTKFFSVKKQNNNWTFSNNLFFGFLNIFLPFRNGGHLVQSSPISGSTPAKLANSGPNGRHFEMIKNYLKNRKINCY